MEKILKLYKVGDSDWIVAHTKSEAKSIFKSTCDYWEDDMEIRELTGKEMQKLIFVEDPDDPDSPKRTFGEELKRWVEAGEGPDMFATSEY